MKHRRFPGYAVALAACAPTDSAAPGGQRFGSIEFESCALSTVGSPAVDGLDAIEPMDDAAYADASRIDAEPFVGGVPVLGHPAAALHLAQNTPGDPLRFRPAFRLERGRILE